MVDVIFIINIRCAITFLYCTVIYFISTFVFYFSPGYFYFYICYPTFGRIILIWFIRFFSSVSHIPFSIHKSCTIFSIPFLTPFSSVLYKNSNPFMYSLFSHFLLGFFDILVLVFLLV